MRLEKAYTIAVVSLLVIGISLAIAHVQALDDQGTVRQPHRVLLVEEPREPGENTISSVSGVQVPSYPTLGGLVSANGGTRRRPQS